MNHFDDERLYNKADTDYMKLCRKIENNPKISIMKKDIIDKLPESPDCKNKSDLEKVMKKNGNLIVDTMNKNQVVQSMISDYSSAYNSTWGKYMKDTNQEFKQMKPIKLEFNEIHDKDPNVLIYDIIPSTKYEQEVRITYSELVRIVAYIITRSIKNCTIDATVHPNTEKGCIYVEIEK